MKNTPIRFLVILGALTMASVVFIQIYWVSQAVDKQEEQFKHSVQMALRNVVESLCEINGNDIPSNDPIDQLSNNYFIARTNYRIDLHSLDYLLKAELQKRNINQDYEFGVYDCQTDRMVYGDFVSMEEKGKTIPAGKLPKLVNDEYYFGVYFPGKHAGIVGSMGIWKLTSALTLVVLVFFSYALFVILKQKRLSEIQKDFINNMTHEFKTPLATLQVSSEVLIAESTTVRQRKYAEIAMAETGRLQRHVQQLLEASQQDHQRLKEKQVSIDVVGAVKDVAQRFAEVPGKILHQTYESANIYVKGDPLVFETIIFNLIDNAIKYGKHQVQVRVSDRQKKVHIEVWNDGETIPKREQGRIFKQFYRINKGNVHDVKGFGLGLYLVKKAVASFHGKIVLRSDESGTCFKLIIPKIG